MNQEILLYGLAAVVLFFVAREVYSRFKANFDALNDRRKVEAAAQCRLAESLDKWTAQIELLPKYMGGFVAVCESQVKQYEDLKTAIQGFTATITGPRKDDGLTPYDEESANSSWIKQEFMAQGKTEEEAMALLERELQKKIVSFPQEF